ncbi:hypothetical protein [Salinicoccus sp. Marseille-QA3877]
MKIKTVKKMNLPELIQYVWENDFSVRGFMVFRSDCDNFEVRVSTHMLDYVWDKTSKFSGVPRHTTFTVSTEKELTEETEFEELWEVYYNKGRSDVDSYTDGKVNAVTSTSVSQILQENSIDYENVTLAIFRKDTLIWSKDTGIPEHGMVEVEVE